MVLAAAAYGRRVGRAERWDGRMERHEDTLAPGAPAKRPAKILLHHHREGGKQRSMEDQVRVFGEVHVCIGAQHAVAKEQRARDVVPLLRPHEEHVARSQAPRRQPGVPLPERCPSACEEALHLLQLPAQWLGGEHKRVVQLQLLQVRKQV